MLKPKFILSLIFITVFWGMIVPIFEFPDEPAHFGATTFLADNHRLPAYKEKDMTVEMYQTQEYLGILRDNQGNNLYTYHPEHHLEYTDSGLGKYESAIINLNNHINRHAYLKKEAARYPPLYYYFTGLFLKSVNQQNIITRLFITRLSSLLIALALTFATYQIGLLVFTKKIHAKTLAIITLLQPMMTFVTAGINSDNFHNLFFTLIILFCLKIIKKGFKLNNLVLLFLALLADIFTKPQGYIAIPIILVAFVIRIIKKRHWKKLSLIVMLGIVFFLLSISQFNPYNSFFSITNSDGQSLVDFISFSANKLITQNIVWYWGVFKWLGVVLPSIYWQIANRVVLISFFGLCFYFYKTIRKKSNLPDFSLIIFLVLTSAIYASTIFLLDWQYLKGWGVSIGVQARYFFPAIVAHLSLLQIGLFSFSWSKTSLVWIRRGLLGLFFWLQLGGLLTIIKSYYQTNSIKLFILQLSQYKPDFLKGYWWYLWGSLYLVSLFYLFIHSLKNSD